MWGSLYFVCLFVCLFFCAACILINILCLISVTTSVDLQTQYAKTVTNLGLIHVNQIGTVINLGLIHVNQIGKRLPIQVESTKIFLIFRHFLKLNKINRLINMKSELLIYIPIFQNSMEMHQDE